LLRRARRSRSTAMISAILWVRRGLAQLSRARGRPRQSPCRPVVPDCQTGPFTTRPALRRSARECATNELKLSGRKAFRCRVFGSIYLPEVDRPMISDRTLIHFLQHGGSGALPTCPGEPGSPVGGSRSIGGGTARPCWLRGSGLFPGPLPTLGQGRNSQRGPPRETGVPSGQSLASILQMRGRAGTLSAARLRDGTTKTAAKQMLAAKIANTRVIDFMPY
jgi:hypothetical protein